MILHRQTEGKTATHRIPVTTTWDSDKPLEVQFTFHGCLDGNITWTFARDLLAEALRQLRACGEGDVRFTPGKPGTTLMTIESDRVAEIEFNSMELAAFLYETERYVMIGEEPGLTDEAIWEWLADAES